MKIRKMICAMLAITIFAVLLTGCSDQKYYDQIKINSTAQSFHSEFESIVYGWSLNDLGLKQNAVQEFYITISNGECTVSAGNPDNFKWSTSLGSWGKVGKGTNIQDLSEATTPEEKIAISLASSCGKNSYLSIYVAIGDEGNKIFVACTSDEGAKLSPGVNCPKPDISEDGMSIPKSFKYSNSITVGTSPVVEAA